MLSADFFFVVIIVILIPLALICSACVVADTVLAYIKHREERCLNCMYGQRDPEPEPEPETDELEELEENNEPEFVQTD